jgi:hypothetical protein
VKTRACFQVADGKLHAVEVGVPHKENLAKAKVGAGRTPVYGTDD